MSTDAPFAPPAHSYDNISETDEVPPRDRTTGPEVSGKRHHWETSRTEHGAGDVMSDNESDDEMSSVELTSPPAHKRARREEENETENLTRARQAGASGEVKPGIGSIDLPIVVDDDLPEAIRPLPSHLHIKRTLWDRRDRCVKREGSCNATVEEADQTDEESGFSEQDAVRKGATSQEARAPARPSVRSASQHAPSTSDSSKARAALFDNALSNIFIDQIWKTPIAYASAIDKGRMPHPPAELDTSPLGHLPDSFRSDDLHAFYHLLRGYSRLTHTSQQCVSRNRTF